MKKFSKDDLVKYQDRNTDYIIVSVINGGTFDYLIAEKLEGLNIGAPFQVKESDLKQSGS
jgi:hypothetical protein